MDKYSGVNTIKGRRAMTLSERKHNGCYHEESTWEHQGNQGETGGEEWIATGQGKSPINRDAGQWDLAGDRRLTRKQPVDYYNRDFSCAICPRRGKVDGFNPDKTRLLWEIWKNDNTSSVTVTNREEIWFKSVEMAASRETPRNN